MNSKHASRIFLTVASLLVFAGPIARADDGYGLWLKYGRLTNQARLQAYREAFSAIVVQGDSATLRIVREEIKRGLDGLLGTDLPVHDTVSEKGAVVIGTNRTSLAIGSLGWDAELKPLGREGFLIRSSQVNGHPATVIAANEEVGLLYGTFALLRLVQTQAPLGRLNVVSRPRIQYRLLNH